VNPAHRRDALELAWNTMVFAHFSFSAAWHVTCFNGSASMASGPSGSTSPAQERDPMTGSTGTPSIRPTVEAVPAGEGLQHVLDRMARFLGVPLALLSRDGPSWRFEAESFPPRKTDVQRFNVSVLDRQPGTHVDVADASGSSWTGLFAGAPSHREWLVMLPGTAERWNAAPGLQETMDQFRRDLEAAVRLDQARELAAQQRRLYAFVRRLTRTSDAGRTYRCILSTMAKEVGATTAALAVFDEAEGALTIVDTRGYPRAIVEHVRITPGRGIIGEAFVHGRVTIGSPADDVRRRRYRTDSYMVVPLVADGETLAVIALTDRKDGFPFDSRDLAAARMLAAPAALAIARHRVSSSLGELVRAATVDPVTGLYNRRYFETRIQEEVERARRQQQDLALLMVDIDDFKRINDTHGHLEGDRALRDVAELLRRGVRIFDLCARYGGEEFVIVMPGAARDMAVHVAERIRRGIQERSQLTPAPLTVSVGVGLLGPGQTEEDLIDAADHALMAAKRAGKNVVKTF
jgi:diguanylate cyclase (GGDEF)-like protein